MFFSIAESAGVRPEVALVVRVERVDEDPGTVELVAPERDLRVVRVRLVQHLVGLGGRRPVVAGVARVEVRERVVCFVVDALL